MGVEKSRSDVLAAAASVAAGHPALRLLVLHGSSARGDRHASSDWDFGYLASRELDHLGLLADLVAVLGTEKIDLVDLSSASALLRFRAARDGAVVVEPDEGAFDRFWFDAVSFWCDAGPVIQRGYAQILDEVRRAEW